MPTEAEKQVYPLSDPRGIPLPFDVGAPEGLWITSVAVAASAEKTLPATWDLVVLYATVDTVIGFGVGVALTLAADVEKVDHQFVPANTPVSIKLPNVKFKVMSANGVSTGFLYVQKYRVWRAASQAVQQSSL